MAGRWNAGADIQEGKYSLACACMNNLYSLPKLKPPVAASDLQRMSNMACEIKHRLRSLKYPVDQWDLVFVNVLHNRLDANHSNKWEVFSRDNDTPTMAMMIKFLNFQAVNALKASQIAVVNASRRPLKTHSPSRSAIDIASASANEYPFGSCGEIGHKIYTCPKFLSLSIRERQRMVRLNGCCPNCLKTNHKVEFCWDPFRCKLQACANNNAHNSLICPNKTQATRIIKDADVESNVGPMSSSRNDKKRACSEPVFKRSDKRKYYAKQQKLDQKEERNGKKGKKGKSERKKSHNISRKGNQSRGRKDTPDNSARSTIRNDKLKVLNDQRLTIKTEALTPDQLSFIKIEE